MWKYVFVAVVGVLALQGAVSGAGEASSTAGGTRTSGLRNGGGGGSGQTERLPAPKPPPPTTRTAGEQIADFPPRSWSARPGMSAGNDPGDLQSEPREGGEEEGQCWADDQECVEQQCQWSSDLGAIYSLQAFSGRVLQTSVQNLKGSLLRFSFCSEITCNGRQTPTCLNVPGVKLTSTGVTSSVTPIEPHVPGRGFKLVLSDGDVCEVTGRPRTTTFHLPCSPNSKHRVENFRAMRAAEGTKENVCRYSVEFPATQFGCPVDGGGTGDRPILTAVQGCVDSLPLRTTEDCHYAARTQLSLHGLRLHLLCPDGSENHFSSPRCTRSFRQRYTVHVGPFTCSDPAVISQFTLNCTVDRGTGKGLDVVVYEKNSEGQREVVMELGGAVSFKDAIDFREKFAKFSELGVGGLKKEIEELYRRAFASRGVSQELLEKMGITHVKGILLYGPPGTGKTLIARTIAKILGSKQVQLINGPEIISKYLGESERNLRAHFEAAQKAWKEHGALSELFVVIIDEIDAICKPRGKTDQSAAGVAYDALVNQLLTLMDGLNEAYNTLVVGLTNRRELLDPALLRPGRFEVQIEVNLPDEEGREEIFEIHTRSMQAAGMLGGGVDLRQLAAATGRFSGAEIAGVVRSASAFALERYQSSSLGSEESVLVTAADFQQAIISINPAYTHSENQVSTMYLPHGYLSCGESHDTVARLTLDLLHMLRHSPTSQLQTLLLYGPRGSGKTALAAHLAMVGKFSFIKFLTASSVVGRPSLHKMEAIRTAFSGAFSSSSSSSSSSTSSSSSSSTSSSSSSSSTGLSLVVLDDLHRLVEFMKVGTQITVSHELLHTITTLITSPVPTGVRVLVVGTLTVEEGVALEDPQFLGLPDLFLHHHLVPLLDCDAALSFLNGSNIHKFGSGQFSLPSNLLVSVRQLHQAIQCACFHGSCSSDHREPSVVRQDHLLDCIMASVTRQMAELDT